MKKWKCTVCGYIHKGPEPPDECPVCGASKEAFVELTEEEGNEDDLNQSASGAGNDEPESASMPPAEKDGGFKAFSIVTDLMSRNHAHPISVHFPNGLAPVIVLFLFLSFIFNAMMFDTAAFYNLVIVALAMPMTLFSGYVDWQAKFNGSMTRVFKHKIAMGLTVTFLAYGLVIWRLLDPDVTSSENNVRFVFFAIHLVMLGAAGYAGHLGGKLVFKD